jgi:hypothetical protein
VREHTTAAAPPRDAMNSRLGHGRRQLLWFVVTRNPSAEWLSQQIAEAFPWNTAPTYLVRE